MLKFFIIVFTLLGSGNAADAREVRADGGRRRGDRHRRPRPPADPHAGRGVDGYGAAGGAAVGTGGGAEREGERGDSTKKEEKHGMVVGSRAHMEGEAVAKVRGVHLHGNRPRVCAWIGGTGPCYLCRQHWLFELVFL